MNDIAVIGGMKSRSERTKLSQEMALLGSLHSPLFNQAKLIPSMTQITLVLTKQDPSFFLKCKDDKKYKYSITSCQFLLRKVQLAESWSAAFEKEFIERPIRYDIKQNYVKDWTLTSGLQTWSTDNPFQNNFLPNFILLVRILAYMLKWMLHKKLICIL